ncbi:hypothetical protein CHFL109739_20020 [Chryseobacterium flavum]
MLGHYSVKQTEEYAITEQEAIGREMKELELRLKNDSSNVQSEALEKMIEELESELYSLVKMEVFNNDTCFQTNIVKIQSILNRMRHAI